MSKYKIILSRRYKTILKRLSRHKDFDEQKLEQVISILAEGGTLAPAHRDHQLSGELNGYRECHVRSDMLLVYQKHDDVLVVLLVEIGTHSSLFR